MFMCLLFMLASTGLPYGQVNASMVDDDGVLVGLRCGAGM